MLNKSASKSSEKELSNRDVFKQLIKEGINDNLIVKDELIWNFHLFVNRQSFNRLLFFQEKLVSLCHLVYYIRFV